MPWRMTSSSDREASKKAVERRPTKEQSCNDFCRFSRRNFKIFTAIWNVGFRWGIYLRSPNYPKWKNVVWPIWSRNLIFAFGFEEYFAKQNCWYIKLFPKAVGRIARPSTPARSFSPSGFRATIFLSRVRRTKRIAHDGLSERGTTRSLAN